MFQKKKSKKLLKTLEKSYLDGSIIKSSRTKFNLKKY